MKNKKLGLKVGNKIKVRGKLYEVIKIESDADYVIEKNAIREYKCYHLHIINSRSLFPTKYLSQYKDTGEIFISGSFKRTKLRPKDIEKVKRKK